jgi:hypothetical protein
VHERHPVEAELMEPLAAGATRRGGDPDRLEVAGLCALDDRPADGAALGADSDRVGGILDVHARDDAPVAHERGGADEELRVGRIGRLRGGHGSVVELLVRHLNT